MARTLKSILKAQGRLRKLSPVAIVDIGSNSVRLVVYEGLSRSPTPLFNEKVLCGLGGQIAQTGRLNEDGVVRALAALRRFRLLAQQTGADDMFILATAAAREASNGPAFIKEAEAILDRKIHVLTGPEEAKFAAFGIVCGFKSPVGVSADMGGGSVEFTLVDKNPVGEGHTLPLGGLRLRDESEGSLNKARQLCRKALAKNPVLKSSVGGMFYAVGGTWRAFGRLHMARCKYPLHVMHNYEISAEEAKKLCGRLTRDNNSAVRGMEAISSSRQALIPFGAVLLQEIMRIMKPEKIVFSGLGVREGYLYSLLPEKVQRADPLLTAAEEMAVLRARSPAHARELVKWTGAAFRALGLSETKDESRYRKAACLLADITWRSHPDYRGDQALNLISNANFVGVDHSGRAYLALASYFRHEGVSLNGYKPPLLAVAEDRVVHRAHVLGALFRVAYLFSAAMPGVLPQIRLVKGDEGFDIVVPHALRNFEGERLDRRLSGLAEVVEAPVAWQVEERLI
ncbi:MAG: exopolyphosphatase [Pseudomonadota bacterium]